MFPDFCGTNQFFEATCHVFKHFPEDIFGVETKARISPVQNPYKCRTNPYIDNFIGGPTFLEPIFYPYKTHKYTVRNRT